MIKVKHTEKQGEHIVAKGKLVLMDFVGSYNYFRLKNGNYITPIIISETEEIEVFDDISCYNTFGRFLGIYKCTKILNETLQVNSEDYQGKHVIKQCKKVLALPEHFSPEQLQSIVDGRLKDGDEIFAECIIRDNYDSITIEIPNTPNHIFTPNTISSYIKLTNSHINLIPINKEESWDEVFRILNNPAASQGTKEALIIERFNKPTKKK